MDFTLTQKEFRERLKETPEKLVDFMGSEEAENAIEKVSQEYKIPPGQTRDLAFYVAHVFLGMLEPKEFRRTIEEDLKFGSEDALHISEELEHKLFNKAKRELHDMYGVKTFSKEPQRHISESPILKEARKNEVLGTNLDLPSKSPLKLPPKEPPPLDLRKDQQGKPPSPEDHEFPGEIVHHGTEEQPEEKGALEELSPKDEPRPEGARLAPQSRAAKEKEFHKPEPLKRHTPVEKDSYLESVEEEKENKGPKPIKEGRTVDLTGLARKDKPSGEV